MEHTKSPAKKFIPVLLSVFISVFVVYLVALGWENPKDPGTPAPITRGSVGQSKSGALSIDRIMVDRENLGGPLAGRVGIGSSVGDDPNTAFRTNDVTARLYLLGNAFISGIIKPNGRKGDPDKNSVLFQKVLSLEPREWNKDKGEYYDPWNPKLNWQNNFAWLTLVSIAPICEGGACNYNCPPDTVPVWDGANWECVASSCGDLVCQNATETCIPGDVPPEREYCKVDCGTCTSEPSPPFPPSGICGDGHIDPGEECEPPFSFRVPKQGVVLVCNKWCKWSGWAANKPPDLGEPPDGGGGGGGGGVPTPSPTPSSGSYTGKCSTMPADSCSQGFCPAGEVCISGETGSRCGCEPILSPSPTPNTSPSPNPTVTPDTTPTAPPGGPGGGGETRRVEGDDNFASLIETAYAQGGNDCSGVVLPEPCSGGWMEYGLFCSSTGDDPMWVRSCYRRIEKKQ